MTSPGIPEIVEPDIPRHVRRPLDLARFLLALAVTGGIVLLAWAATSTAAGLGSDLSSGVSLLPAPIVLSINIIGGIGTLGLPVAAAISLIVRKRLRQLVDALIALLVAFLVLTATTEVVASIGSARLIVALAGSLSTASTSTAPILGGLVAFATVARLMGRRPWGALVIVVVASIALVTVLSSGIALAGVGISISLGWAIGLIARYALGTPTTRPSGTDVAEALARGGFPVQQLTSEVTTRRGRRYRAQTTDGRVLRVTVLDRDLEGADIVSTLWQSVRLRDERGLDTLNMRRGLDHAALTAYAAMAANAPVAELHLVAEVGPDATLMAFEYLDAIALSDCPDLTAQDAIGAWQAVQRLHEHQISHRALTAENILRSPDGRIWLVGQDKGAIAASDVAMRIDLADLLCTLSLLLGVEAAVSSGRAVLGDAELSRALAVMQPVALSPSTRAAMRKRREILVELRDALVQLRPGIPVEQIQLRRVRPRTLIMIIVGSIAGYVLLSQLAQVDLATLLTTANWEWLLVALLLSLVTYVGAAWSLSGFVPERLRLHRTVLAQLAGDFATLVSPPTLGAVAINLRYLQRAGLHPALAAASVGVSQVMAFVFHIGLLLAFGIAAGTQADLTFNPPQEAVIAVVAIAVALIALLAIPAIRRPITRRLLPTLREVGPRLVTVAQRPLKLTEGIGGILLLNLAYIGVLIACINAFGGSLSIAVIAVVYLAGATLGQAAPTPGGLGAVEAALSAGLTAAGLDGGIAVSAVLLYRLVTFWLPTVPGYWAFTWLTRKGAL